MTVSFPFHGEGDREAVEGLLKPKKAPIMR